MTLEQNPNNGMPETGDLVNIKYKTILKDHPLISEIPNGKFKCKSSGGSYLLQRFLLILFSKQLISFCYFVFNTIFPT